MYYIIYMWTKGYSTNEAISYTHNYCEQAVIRLYYTSTECIITLKILLKVLMKMTNTIMRVHLVMDTFDIFTHSLPQACNFVRFPTTQPRRIYTAMCSLQHVPMNYISVFS